MSTSCGIPVDGWRWGVTKLCRTTDIKDQGNVTMIATANTRPPEAKLG